MTRTVRTALVAAAAIAILVPAAQAEVKKGRGNIQAVDWNVMQVAIKGVDGKVNTFRVRNDVGVLFTDAAEGFPNPRLQDIAPPMYVYFDFEDFGGQEAGLIQKFEVRDMPADMRKAGRPGRTADTSATTSTSANTRELKVRIIKITDEDKGEFRADVAGRQQNFRADRPRDLRRVRENDLVVITLARNGTREVVTDFRVVDR